MQTRKIRTGIENWECLHIPVVILDGLVRVSLREKVTCDLDLKRVRRESCWVKSFPADRRQT